MGQQIGGKSIIKKLHGSKEITLSILNGSVIYSSVQAIPNTLIGGLGATVTDAEALETLLELNAGEVSYFNLNGVNIEAIIDVTYDIPTNKFNANLDITSYNDIEGKCDALGSYVFQNATNFVYQNFPSCVNYGNSAFLNTSLVNAVVGNINNLITVSSNCFQNCLLLETVVMLNNASVELSSGTFTGCEELLQITPSFPFNKINAGALSNCYKFDIYTLDFSIVHTTGTGCFQNTLCTGPLVFPALLATGTNTFLYCSSITSIDAPLLQNVGQNCFYGQVLLTTVNLPSVTLVKTRGFWNCDLLTNLSLPECIEFNGTYHLQGSGLQYLYAPKLEILGSTVDTNNSVFSLVTGAEIIVGLGLKTANAGQPDFDLVEAVIDGNTVSYFGDFNTLIEGVGASITTDLQLELKLGLNGGDVTYFELDGLDVKAYIDVNYDMPPDTFNTDQTILSFYDYEGKVGKLNQYCFSSSTIIIADFPEATTMGNGPFRTAPDLQYAYMPKMTNIAYRAFYQAYSLLEAHYPMVTSITTHTNFSYCTSLLSVRMDSLVTYVATSVWSYCSSINSFYAPLLEKLNNSSLRNTGPIPVLSLPSCTYVEINAITSSGAIDIQLPEVVTLGDGCMSGAAASVIYTPKCLFVGDSDDSAVNDWVFNSITNCHLTIDTSTSTDYDVNAFAARTGNTVTYI